MSEEQKGSPRPWTFVPFGSYMPSHVVDADGAVLFSYVMGDTQAMQDAVIAVNSHSALVDALSGIILAYDSRKLTDDVTMSEEQAMWLGAGIESARKVLAAAKGGAE